MTHPKQKSPNLAETGFSENIHSASMNETYISMIFCDSQCLVFCCNALDRYEALLQRFILDNPEVYFEKEVDTFAALSNIEKSLSLEVNDNG